MSRAADGEAVTSTVTEFKYKTDSHPYPFKVEIVFYSKKESEDLIEELVWSYRRFCLLDVNEAIPDYERLKQEKETAWQTLKAAFGHHENLQSLCDRENEDEIKTQLVSWWDELEWPPGHLDGYWAAFIESAEDCCEIISQFAKDQFWPFIKIIR